MIIPGQRSLLLSVHNRFVITFTNTLFHINWLRRFSDASRLHCSNKQPSNTLVRFFTHLIVVVLVDRLETLARIDIAPLPCLGCFCTVLLCCLITWATHSHPFRTLVYCGCQQVRAVDQQCANPLAAALLLHCTELYTCVRLRPS